MIGIRFILLLSGIFVVLFVITLLLHRLFQRIKYVKYLPSFALLVMAAYYMYLSTRPYTGFEDIGNAIIAIMAFVGFLSGLISALIFDYRSK